MYRFYNIFVNKIVNILIVAILILIAFFIGLNTANAETIPATMWGTALENHINSLTSTTTYNYTDYNSDSIREFIYEKSNEQFFDNTYNHQKEFYRDYNYVVMAYSQTTIRVFVQNYNRVVAYQGFQTMPVEPYFYFANMTIQYRAGTSTYWRTGVNAIYSYYIDINYNTKSYTFSDNNPLTDLNFYLLGTGYHYKDSNKPFGSTDINMKLLDSFNGNFAWIETWNEIENTEALWYQCSGYTTTSTILGYFNSIVDFPELDYVSTPFPDDEGGEGDDEGGGSSDNSVLEGIVSDIKDIINNAVDKVEDFFDWITGGFNSSDSESSINDFFNNFHDEDNGGISRIVKAPLRIIQNLNNSTCTPLILPIFGTEVEVPSGCILWENATEEIETLWHTIICGMGSYILLIDLFKEIQKLKNPRNSEVSTLDL